MEPIKYISRLLCNSEESLRHKTVVSLRKFALFILLHIVSAVFISYINCLPLLKLNPVLPLVWVTFTFSSGLHFSFSSLRWSSNIFSDSDTEVFLRCLCQAWYLSSRSSGTRLVSLPWKQSKPLTEAFLPEDITKLQEWSKKWLWQFSEEECLANHFWRDSQHSNSTWKTLHYVPQRQRKTWGYMLAGYQWRLNPRQSQQMGYWLLTIMTITAQ